MARGAPRNHIQYTSCFSDLKEVLPTCDSLVCDRLSSGFSSPTIVVNAAATIVIVVEPGNCAGFYQVS
jgi:hypothetical protein